MTLGEIGPEAVVTAKTAYVPMHPATAVVLLRAFTEALHPRDAGKFAVKAGSGNKTVHPTAVAAGKKGKGGKGKGAGTKGKPADGNLSFDGKRGAGYGTPGGDKRVHSLQQALNRLGLTDGAGNKLKDDGKLGPKTTAAIKKAQRALGLKADGVVTPALLKKITSAKGKLTPDAKKTTAKKVDPHARVKPTHPTVRSGKSSTAPKKAPVSIHTGS